MRQSLHRWNLGKRTFQIHAPAIPLWILMRICKVKHRRCGSAILQRRGSKMSKHRKRRACVSFSRRSSTKAGTRLLSIVKRRSRLHEKIKRHPLIVPTSSSCPQLASRERITSFERLGRSRASQLINCPRLRDKSPMNFREKSPRDARRVTNDVK